MNNIETQRWNIFRFYFASVDWLRMKNYEKWKVGTGDSDKHSSQLERVEWWIKTIFQSCKYVYGMLTEMDMNLNLIWFLFCGHISFHVLNLYNVFTQSIASTVQPRYGWKKSHPTWLFPFVFRLSLNGCRLHQKLNNQASGRVLVVIIRKIDDCIHFHLHSLVSWYLMMKRKIQLQRISPLFN